MRLLYLLVGLIILAPTSSAADPYAPSFVAFAQTTTQTVSVGWLPGSEMADAYRVYGIDATGTPHLLGETSAATLANGSPSLEVDGSFASYAVSGVLGGVESPMTMGMDVSGGSDPCIDIRPPNVAVNCIPIIGPITT